MFGQPLNLNANEKLSLKLKQVPWLVKMAL